MDASVFPMILAGLLSSNLMWKNIYRRHFAFKYDLIKSLEIGALKANGVPSLIPCFFLLFNIFSKLLVTTLTISYYKNFIFFCFYDDFCNCFNPHDHLSQSNRCLQAKLLAPQLHLSFCLFDWHCMQKWGTFWSSQCSTQYCLAFPYSLYCLAFP